MKIKFLAFISLMSLAATAEAVTCNYNPNNNLVEGSPDGTLDISNNIEGAADYTGILISPELVKCDNAIPGTPISPTDPVALYTTFRFGASQHLDLTKSRGTYPGGGSYYKLKATGSDFVNKYGYIHFRIAREDGYSKGTISSTNLILYNSASGPANIGIQVDLVGIRFFNDVGVPIAGPSEKIDALSIELGEVSHSFKKFYGPGDLDYDFIMGSQKAYLTLNIQPSLAESCSVNSQTVQLPDVPAGNLTSVGDEIGGTSFNVIASCGSADAGKQLMYTLVDNNAPLNVRSDVLTNTVSDTQNVGVAVYDDTGARVITYNTTGILGTLSGGVNPSASKRFLARYHKLDNLPVKPGLLNAQATILVNYK